MQYLAMIYGDAGRWEALSDEERTATYARYTAFAEEAGAAGVLVDGAELKATASATTRLDRRRRRLGRPHSRRGPRRDRSPALLRRRVRGGRGMKYALLLTNSEEDRERWATMPEEEAQAARAAEVPKWNALFGELGASGKLLSGSELDDPGTAKTVRVRNGERVVTDGPFAETKEQIGGLMVIEADDLD